MTTTPAGAGAKAMPRERRRLSPQERRRRRRRRTGWVFVYVVVAFGLAWFFESQATTTVLFVRHADVDDPASITGDPALNAVGRARADLLARFVADVDVLAGLDAIYANDTRRTRQTAEPIARQMGLEIRSPEPEEPEPFMASVLDEHKGEIVLVVTDREDVPPLVAELHGHQNVPEIAPAEYDNFYIVTIPWGGGAKVKTLRLRYGLGWEPDDLRMSGGSISTAER